MVLLLDTTYISVDLAHHEIFRAKVGKGGINNATKWGTYIYFVALNECKNIVATEEESAVFFPRLILWRIIICPVL